uniref:glycerate kinase type-2 family protein n=1 Tax=Hydrotalea sp. TaxID=2881279 RepID=UPI0026284618
NTLRKHLSKIKGGQLAQLLMPARVITLAISDVMGDDPSVIGSGPTVPDSSTFLDAWTIVQQYSLQQRIPLSVHQYLQKGLNDVMAETPKIHDACFQKTNYYLLGNNGMALQSAKQAAEKLGYHAIIVSKQLSGEAKEAGVAIVQQALAYNGLHPACLLFGGETTVIIHGNGLGGRNQELALAAALALPEHASLQIVAAGTDGTDGPTDAAGAFTNVEQMQLARQLGVDAKAYLENNDAYHFFEKVNGLIKTGPTQTNVMDVVIVLIP